VAGWWVMLSIGHHGGSFGSLRLFQTGRSVPDLKHERGNLYSEGERCVRATVRHTIMATT